MRAHCVDCGLPTFGMDLRTGVERCLPCKKKHLGREPREFTEEEVRGRVLDHIWGMIQYWHEEQRRQGTLEKMEGLAFSILVMLDGEASDIPGFMVAPVSHPDNKEFSKKEIQDWYPENQEAEKVVNCDIGGSLHDTFHKHRPKGLPKDDSARDDVPQPARPPSVSTPLDKFILNQMTEVTNHLQKTVLDFSSKAWPSIARFLMESTAQYYSGMFGDVKVMIASSPGSALATLWRAGKELTMSGPVSGMQQSFSGLRLSPCGLNGISGSAEEVRSLAKTVIDNWDVDKLKRDDELGVAWKKREKDIRDLYSDK